MGVLGELFGCSGVVGFNGRCLGVSIGDGGFTLVCISGCRGVIGFNVATSQLSMREKVRPARLVAGLSVTKFAQHAKKWLKLGGLWRAGRVLYRVGPRMPCAGRILSRIPAR